MTTIETINGYYCQVCQGRFPTFTDFRLHEDGSGDVCPGGEP